MKDTRRTNFLATIDAPADSLLLGPHHWTVFNDSRSCQADSGNSNTGNSYTVKLSLTSCISSNEFTCGDGTCISLEKKCDGRNDCNDKSDEAEDCKILTIPEGYWKQTVPQSTQGSKLAVNVSLRIDGFLEVNEVEQYIKIQFTLTNTWFDQRLTFQNLQNNSVQNILSNYSDLWYPYEIFVNIDRTKRSDTAFKSYRILRSHKKLPYPKPIRELRNAYMFKGSDNAMQRTAYYTYAWNCPFDFRLYPFDTQYCTMKLGLKDADTMFLKLNPVMIKHMGNKDELAQYTIEKISFCSDTENQGLVVNIVLRRPLISSILTVFIPTLLLLIISQLAQVFVNDFIDMVIQVHLTLLLVLASL